MRLSVNILSPFHSYGPLACRSKQMIKVASEIINTTHVMRINDALDLARSFQC
jgi:hypothetical protein